METGVPENSREMANERLHLKPDGRVAAHVPGRTHIIYASSENAFDAF